MADIKINGATPSAFYFGSTAATAVYYGSTKLWEATPAFPANTIRCKFRSGYTPNVGDTKTLVDASENIWDIYKSGTSWFGFFAGVLDIVSVIEANTTGVTNMSYMFSGCTNLMSVSLFDTSSVTTMEYMFDGCSHLITVPLFNTSSVTEMGNMFSNCGDLTNVPLFDTSSATYMYNMFLGCSKLTSVPLFDTSSATNMSQMFHSCSRLTAVPLLNTSHVTTMTNMFYGCTSVESGALALYQQASTQATPPTTHTDTFKNCGALTASGSIELSQIPASWGGTGS